MSKNEEPKQKKEEEEEITPDPGSTQDVLNREFGKNSDIALIWSEDEEVSPQNRLLVQTELILRRNQIIEYGSRYVQRWGSIPYKQRRSLRERLHRVRFALENDFGAEEEYEPNKSITELIGEASIRSSMKFTEKRNIQKLLTQKDAYTPQQINYKEFDKLLHQLKTCSGKREDAMDSLMVFEALIQAEGSWIEFERVQSAAKNIGIQLSLN